jgi:hypothetical protein
MRRSLAPSQAFQKRKEPSQTIQVSTHKKNDDQVTISRLPLFGFLEIPEVLNKQFKVPSGCIITEELVALMLQYVQSL